MIYIKWAQLVLKINQNIYLIIITKIIKIIVIIQYLSFFVGPTGFGKSKTRDLVIKNFNLDIEVDNISEVSIDNVIEANKDYRIFLNLIFELYNNDKLVKNLVKNTLELKKWNHFFKFFKNYKAFLNADGRMDSKYYRKFNNYKLIDNPILKTFISDCNLIYFSIVG